ncbi:MAG: hypothetical protein LCH56_05885 [Proteobacteria bacterium]|nr:hypothetical protein [Pseudomonadota bacterium]
MSIIQILKSPEAAAWAQFFAAVAAIVISIAFPLAIRSADRAAAKQERRELRGCIVFSVWVPLERMEKEFTRLRDLLDDALKDGAKALDDNRWFNENRTLLKPRTTDIVAIPLAELQYLGAKIAGRLIRLQAGLVPLAAMCEELTNSFLRVQRDGRLELIKKYREEAEFFRGYVKAIQQAIEPYYHEARGAFPAGKD